MNSCILARATYIYRTRKEKDKNRESRQIFQTHTNGHSMTSNDFRKIDANNIEFGKLVEKPAVKLIDDKN